MVKSEPSSPNEVASIWLLEFEITTVDMKMADRRKISNQTKMKPDGKSGDVSKCSQRPDVLRGILCRMEINMVKIMTWILEQSRTRK